MKQLFYLRKYSLSYGTVLLKLGVPKMLKLGVRLSFDLFLLVKS